MITQLPRDTDMQTLSAVIFGKCNVIGKLITKRKVPKYLKMHLKLETDYIGFEDIPALLVGHYTTETLPVMPFTCSFNFVSLANSTAPSHHGMNTLSLGQAIQDAPHMLQTQQETQQHHNTPQLQEHHTASHLQEHHMSDAPQDLSFNMSEPLQHMREISRSRDCGTQDNMGLDRAEGGQDPPHTTLTQSVVTQSHTSTPEEQGGTIVDNQHRYLEKSILPKLLNDSFINEIASVSNENVLLEDRISRLSQTEPEILEEELSSDPEIVFDRLPPDEQIEKYVQKKMARKRKQGFIPKSPPAKRDCVVPSIPVVDKEEEIRLIYDKITDMMDTDYFEYLTVLKELNNAPGDLAARLLNNSMGHFSLSTKDRDYIFRNRAGILFDKLKERMTNRLAQTSILAVNLSPEEIEIPIRGTNDHLCLDCRTVHNEKTTCVNHVTGGPSILTKVGDKISKEVWSKFSFVMYGFTPSFRFLDPNQIESCLNLSPLTTKKCSGLMLGSLADENFTVPPENELYTDLKMLVGKLEDCDLPLLVEFNPRKDIMTHPYNLPLEIEAFVRTLQCIQKLYKGIVVSVCPLPTCSAVHSLTDYHVIKTIIAKMGVYLMAFGIIAGVYSIYADISTQPVGKKPRYFTVRKRNKRSPILDFQGMLTREGQRRFYLEMSNELRHIRYLSSFRQTL